MKILIVRHGEAESFANTDRERQLTEHGRLQIRKAGDCLLSLDMSFDQLWVSPYCRAQQSADELACVIGDIDRKSKGFLIPDSTPARVLQAVECAKQSSLLIVSHQPLVSLLVALMVGAKTTSALPMATASMACIDTETVLPGCCHLRWLRHAPDFDMAF